MSIILIKFNISEDYCLSFPFLKYYIFLFKLFPAFALLNY